MSCCGMAAAEFKEPWQKQDSWTIQSMAEESRAVNDTVQQR